MEISWFPWLSEVEQRPQNNCQPFFIQTGAIVQRLARKTLTLETTVRIRVVPYETMRVVSLLTFWMLNGDSETQLIDKYKAIRGVTKLTFALCVACVASKKKTLSYRPKSELVC